MIFGLAFTEGQKAQALAMQMAIDAHRLRKGHCWGTLFWQYNDCWPGPSWSSRDVYGNWKQLHRDLEFLYAPVALIPERKGKNTVIWLVNDLKDAVDVEVEILENDKVLYSKTLRIDQNGLQKVLNVKSKKGKLKIILRKKGITIFERKVN